MIKILSIESLVDQNFAVSISWNHKRREFSDTAIASGFSGTIYSVYYDRSCWIFCVYLKHANKRYVQKLHDLMDETQVSS